ncbi:MAG TPA: hypothetical protein VMC86_13000 [Gemmatimonadales bacterium]|nr:hypothetical protein [Gemmatimonadales bacterium]
MDNEFQRLADIEVEAVRPDLQGFTLTGQGPDHAEYRLDVHFDLPIDARTRAVLGELLSHSGLTISRRATAPAAPARRRDRAHRT